MDLVGAGLDGCVEDSSRRTAQLGTEVRSLNLEFRDRIGRRKNDKVCSVQEVHIIGIVVDTVQQVVVLRRPQTVGGKSTVPRIAASIRLRGVHAGRQLSQKSK